MAKKKVAASKRSAKAEEDGSTKSKVFVEIPRLRQVETEIVLVGDRPLLVNNKMAQAEGIAAKYDGGKSGSVPKDTVPPEQMYKNAFYVLPDSKYPAPHSKARYGIPASGIKKCACSAIRTTGINDNTTVGLIAKSFWVLADSGGLCLLSYEKLERDIRAAAIGSGAKTVPSMRYRPMFHGWKIRLRLKYNAKVLSQEQILNLFMHAGQYIGLCEMRAEKKQGECGGFYVEGT